MTNPPETPSAARVLFGPRVAPRLWDRHVLNSAVVADLFPAGEVADIGSGAGLPGIPLAIARPDLRLTLVEPLARRTVWLEATVDALGLDNVTVVRGRAESLWGQQRFGSVTARAVARLGELARVSLPLLAAGGSLHALKGDRAETELAEDEALLTAYGPLHPTITRHGAGLLDPETVVLTLTPAGEVPVPRSPRAGGGRRSRR